MVSLSTGAAHTILVAAGLRDRAGHDAAVAALRTRAKPGVRVVSGLDRRVDGGVDWDEVRAAEGGWDGAYAWAARSYSAVCAVPVDGCEGLSRGVAAIVQEALALGRLCLLARRCESCAGRGEVPAGGKWQAYEDMDGEPCRACAGARARVQRLISVRVVNPREYKGVYAVARVEPIPREGAGAAREGAA